jgi:hypothetical protein
MEEEMSTTIKNQPAAAENFAVQAYHAVEALAHPYMIGRATGTVSPSEVMLISRMLSTIACETALILSTRYPERSQYYDALSKQLWSMADHMSQRIAVSDMFWRERPEKS